MSSNYKRKPDWLKIKVPSGKEYVKVKDIVERHKLHTICTSGKCPNMAECWGLGTATFIILGDICTRSCKFCATKTGKPEYNYVYDIDGNRYKTITIGEQKWTAENLKTNGYTDGTYIPWSYNSNWDSYCDTGKAWSYYDNVNDYLESFGALYNWPAAMNGASSSAADFGHVQGVCPKGWHLPANDEWLTQENFLIENGYNYDETYEGNKIAKSLASTQWCENSNFMGAVGNYTNSNNRSGFSAVPGGICANDGQCCYINMSGNWWTTSEMGNGQANFRTLENSFSHLEHSYGSKSMGASVRCLRD